MIAAAAIKAAPTGRSAQWLSEETERLGFPISRAQIANYESGRKNRLDLAELLVLAAALRVPPVVLLFPDLPDGPVEALPDLTVDSWDAAAWFSGEGKSIVTDVSAGTETADFKRIWAVRERFRQLGSVGRFHEWLREILKRPEPMGNAEREMTALNLNRPAVLRANRLTPTAKVHPEQSFHSLRHTGLAPAYIHGVSQHTIRRIVTGQIHTEPTPRETGVLRWHTYRSA